MINKDELLRMALMKADEYGIRREWVFALIKIESNWDYYAVRFEPNWKYFFKPEYFAHENRITVGTEKTLQGCSFGLMQVMGTVAREFDHRGPILEMVQPDVGLKYGCLKFLSLIRKYGYTMDSVAAYNAGAPIKENGIYVNKAYVDKFQNALNGVIA